MIEQKAINQKMSSDDWKKRLAELEHHEVKLRNTVQALKDRGQERSSDFAFYSQNLELTGIAIEWCRKLASRA